MIRPSWTPCWVFRSLWSVFCPRLEVLCANLFPNPSSVTHPLPKLAPVHSRSLNSCDQMLCSSLLYQGQHRLPKKATAFLWPWVGRWALGIGKQPEDIWHGWTAGVPRSRPHWLSAFGDLEGHREAWLSLMTPAAMEQWAVAPTHRPLEGCTCLSPLHSWEVRLPCPMSAPVFCPSSLGLGVPVPDLSH